jgi:hypothetical protein
MSALCRARSQIHASRLLNPLLQHIRRSTTVSSESTVKTTPLTSLLIANRGEIALYEFLSFILCVQALNWYS